MVRAATLSAVLVCAACLSSGCIKRDPMVIGASSVTSGKWQIERAIDRITNAPVSSAMTVSIAADNSRVDYPLPAVMQLTCFKGEPVVRFAFQFKIGSTRNSQFGYTFDKDPGYEPEVRFIDGYTSVVIEDQREVARFAQQMAHARSVYVRIRSLNAGRSSAEFLLDGANDAMQAAYASCPIANNPPGRKPAKTAKLTRAHAAEPEPEDDFEPAVRPRFQTDEERALRQVIDWVRR